MLHNIPYKYRGSGVLHDILLIAIRDNWPRIKDYYNDVYGWLEKTGIDRDIDKALLAKFRKDIRQDGPFFIESPDGIGGRLKDWLVEAFPQAFAITTTETDDIEEGASLHQPYESGGIYDDEDDDG